MTKKLRIGTRDSDLALWQANKVKNNLEALGHTIELVHIKSTGDLNQNAPLNQLGSVGVFTKALDDALLNNEIDLAVHSLKDVPTVPESGISQAAVLKRDAFSDVLISAVELKALDDNHVTIATGSLRRKAQWLNKYPNHTITGIRGNVPTRIQKINDEPIDATILSSAGIERLGIKIPHAISLDWMIPAPAQGVIGLFCRTEDDAIMDAVSTINDEITEKTAHCERMLLRTLEGGCSAPIGAFAKVENDEITLHAVLLDPSGQQKIEMKASCDIEEFDQLGQSLAQKILESGGEEIVKRIKENE